MAKKLSKSDKTIESFFGKGSCAGMSSYDNSISSASREKALKKKAKKRGR